ncbi:hypothetical protein [Alcanivorax sp.]|jgi:hypothetical protein|uniref:hypothetical protein n=1 Tax=Alcanivorax sp. TaxID=1872427 RepID=UPI0032D8EBEC
MPFSLFLNKKITEFRLVILHVTRGWTSTAVWLSIVVMLITATFFVLIDLPEIKEVSLLTQVYRALSIATFADWSVSEKGALSRSFAFEILRIVVPLIALGGLLLVAFRSFGFWVQFCLMPKKNHTVVFGLGRAGMAHVEHWRTLSGKFRHGPLVVIERDPENPNIRMVRAMGIPVFVSAAGSNKQEAFKRTKCHSASRIVSMMDKDSKDIELTLHLQQYLSQIGSNKKPKLFVQINEAKLAVRLSDYPRVSQTDLMDIRFESLYARCAEDLLLRYPPEIYADVFSVDRPHIAIHGFNQLGTQILAYCARICHFRNYKSVKITILDDDIYGVEQALERDYPGFFVNEKKCEHAALSIEAVLERSDNSFLKHTDPITQHVICDLDEEVAFRNALELRSSSLWHRKGNAAIFVNSERSDGLAALLDSNTGQSEIPDGLYPFGMVDEMCDPVHLDSFELDRISKGIHEFAYRAVHNTNIKWSDLSSGQRRSNRYAALHIDTKLRSIRWRRVAQSGKSAFSKTSHERVMYFPRRAVGRQSIEKGCQQTEAVLACLSVMEHNRWVGSHLAEGWTQSSGRFDSLKIHNRLNSWDCLPMSEKEKDRTQVRVLPALLEGSSSAMDSVLHEVRPDWKGLANSDLDQSLFLGDKAEFGYAAPVLNIGVIFPWNPVFGDGEDDRCANNEKLSKAAGQVIDRIENIILRNDWSPDGRLAFTLTTPLVSDVEQAFFYYLNLGLDERFSCRSNEERSGSFYSGSQIEGLIVLPLPYNFMTDIGLFKNERDSKEESVWGVGGARGFQNNSGKTNVSYVEMPIGRSGSEYGRNAQGEDAVEEIKEQFEATWKWIAERSDILCIITSNEPSKINADQLKSHFCSALRAKAYEVDMAILPKAECFSDQGIKTRICEINLYR